MSDQTFTIVTKADGTNAHAAYDYNDDGRLLPFCGGTLPRPRLGRTVQGAVRGYVGIATFDGDLCPQCRDLAQRIVADEEAIEARLDAEGRVAGRTIRFVVEYVVPETATKVSQVTIRERLASTLAGRDSYVRNAKVVSAEIL